MANAGDRTTKKPTAKERKSLERQKKQTSADPLKFALASIEKKYGKGSVQQGRGTIVPVEVWPSNIATLDIALGCGGIPRGRIIEVFGAESSGKTTLCLELVAACQHTEFRARDGGVRDGVVAFIDAEHALDPQWAEHIGVDFDRLLLSQPSCGEEALDIAEELTEAGVDLVVVDSVASLVPKEELDGDITDANIGIQARMMSKAMRKLASKANQHGTVIVFINQIREKIGVMFGDSKTTPGGRALKFYSSIRIDVKGTGFLKAGDKKVGRQIKATVVKNKVAPPFRDADYAIMFGYGGQYGVNKITPLVDAAVATKVIQQKGSSFRYEADGHPPVKANGWEDLYEQLAARPELFAGIREQTYKELLGGRVLPPPAEEYDEDVIARLEGGEEIEDDD